MSRLLQFPTKDMRDALDRLQLTAEERQQLRAPYIYTPSLLGVESESRRYFRQLENERAIQRCLNDADVGQRIPRNRRP